MIEEDDGAAPHATGDLGKHPVVLRRVFVGRARRQQDWSIPGDAERLEIDPAARDRIALQAAAEPRQADQPFRVMVLRIGRLGVRFPQSGGIRGRGGRAAVL